VLLAVQQGLAGRACSRTQARWQQPAWLPLPALLLGLCLGLLVPQQLQRRPQAQVACSHSNPRSQQWQSKATSRRWQQRSA
jgi:hypothetical protein